MNRYWLSFSDDTGFRGVVVVRANSHRLALARVNEIGKNPGGEVLILPMEDRQDEDTPEEVLLLESQLRALGHIDGQGLTRDELENVYQHPDVAHIQGEHNI